jgi:hypothetical protein
MENTAANDSGVQLTPLGEVLWHSSVEMLRAVVSGASMTVVLYGCVHLLKNPIFGIFYAFFVDHMEAKWIADPIPLAVLFASISCFFSSWNWRKYVDQWLCKPIIRLLTHLYGLGSGAMLASAIIGIGNAQFQFAMHETLPSAVSLFFRAGLAAFCFAMTELAADKFLEGDRGRINVMIAFGAFLLALAVIMFWKAG